MMQDMHVPSVGRGGLGSSSQAPTGSIGIYEDEDEDDEEVDQRHEELGPSQLHDAPSTQPTHPACTRRRRPPNPFTPSIDTLGPKGKGKTRRQLGLVVEFVVDVIMDFVDFHYGLLWTVWTIIMDCMDYYYGLYELQWTLWIIMNSMDF
jgi:hypothetical protein